MKDIEGNEPRETTPEQPSCNTCLYLQNINSKHPNTKKKLSYKRIYKCSHMQYIFLHIFH